MSRFSGPQGRGAMTLARAIKKSEAETRNAATPTERTRAHREGAASKRGKS